MGDVQNILLKPMFNYYENYGKDDEVAEALKEYIKPLSWVSDDVLREAWQQIMIKHKTRPKVAHILEICNKIPTKAPQQAVEWQLTDHQILSSKEGQEALREGHGNNYLVACRNINKILPAEPVIRANSNLDYSDLRGKGREMYLNHIEEMKVKEAKLKEKYYG